MVSAGGLKRLCQVNAPAGLPAADFLGQRPGQTCPDHLSLSHEYFALFFNSGGLNRPTIMAHTQVGWQPVLQYMGELLHFFDSQF